MQAIKETIKNALLALLMIMLFLAYVKQDGLNNLVISYKDGN